MPIIYNIYIYINLLLHHSAAQDPPKAKAKAKAKSNAKKPGDDGEAGDNADAKPAA